MYFHDVHILYYVLAGVLGLLVGSFINWCNYRMPEGKKVFCKEMLKKNKMIKPNYWLMFFMAVCYIALLYFFGMGKGIYGNLTLIQFLILIPMLLCAFVIDYQHQIIPNRLNLTMFEVGLVFAFLHGIANINIAMDMFLGMIAGAGIFLVITLIGGLIAGKEAMGFGDVKLMGALGLFFGLANMIVISLIAFLLGAVISIILLVSKVKKSDEYIPFGPFIVIGALIVIFVPFGTLVSILLKVFTLGMYGRLR